MIYMKIAIVIPAYNEEEYLPLTLESIANQTRCPDRLVVVDDGSSDGTPVVCKSFSETFDFISFITNIKKEKRASGSKVVRAFNLGLKQIELEDYDIIAKIDSDIGFPPDYFEKLENAFIKDEELGLYGGVCQILQDDQWVEEVVSNRDHVRGALKAYRVAAFRQMNGLRTIMGWDSIDEFLLRFYGWKVVCDPALKVKHYRVTHSLNGWKKESSLNGEVFFNLGYNLPVAAISSIKRAVTKPPYLITGLISFASYLKHKLSSKKIELDSEQRRFINRYRMRNSFNRLKSN